MENPKVEFESNALHDAVLSSDSTTVRVLLDKGINIDQVDEESRSALDLASLHNKSDILKLLRDTKQLLELSKSSSRSRKQVVNSIKLLIDRGACVNARDGASKSALLYAVERNDSFLAKFLMQHDADFTIRTDDNKTLLHLASERNNCEVVKTILERCSARFCHEDLIKFLDTKDTNGDTALHLASITGNLSSILLLLKHGAVFDAPNNCGQTPVDLARPSIGDVYERIGKTFDRAPDVDWNWYVRENVTMARRRDGYTMFCLAVENNNADLIDDILYDQEVDLNNMTTSSGLTALHIASQNGNVDMVNKLLDYESSKEFLDARTYDTGDSALHLSANKAVAKALLKHGATYCILNSVRMTPMEQNPSEEVRALLRALDQAFESRRLAPDIEEDVLDARDSTGSSLRKVIRESSICDLG